MTIKGRWGRRCRDIVQRRPLCAGTILGKGLRHSLSQTYGFAFCHFLLLLCLAVIHLPLLGLGNCPVCPEDVSVIFLRRAVRGHALLWDRRSVSFSRAKEAAREIKRGLSTGVLSPAITIAKSSPGNARTL